MKMMTDQPIEDARLLVLETSGKRGQLALARGETILDTRSLDEGRHHARDLAPTIAAMLKQAGWSAKQLSAVIVSRGPGSYTGLRVGIMSAKTFAYATGCALLAVETFAAIAQQAPAECDRLDVIADAQQQNIYVQSFVHGKAGELTIQPFHVWLDAREKDAWISGPGLAKWQAQLPTDVRCVAAELREPDVRSLHALGLARFRNNERDDVFAVEPLYLRASSAEEQWRARGR